MNTKLLPIALAIMLMAAAVPMASATDSSTTVTNETPVVSGVSVASTVTPTAGTTTSVAVTITVSDGNGYQDISSVSYAVYKPDGTTVHVASAAATSNADGSGTTQTYAGSFTMQFYDDPATGASKYQVRATATDAAAATSTAVNGEFNYAELAALSLSASSIGFGSLAPGATSTASTLTVTNHGNVGIDIATSGTALSNGAGQSIPVSSVKYDLVNATMGSKVDLTSSAFTNTGFDLAKGSASSKGTYWQVVVPSGSGQYIPASTYSGTVTVSAIKG